MFSADNALDLLRLNSDWLWGTDAGGILTEWSGSNGAPSARTPKHWSFYLRRDAETRDGLMSLLTAIRRRKPFHCLKIACTLPHADVRGWVKMSGIPVFDDHGQFQGYRGAAMNMTGQMMAERKLGRLGAQVTTLMHILDSSPVGVIMADREDCGWRITYANQAIATLYGTLPDLIPGRDLFFMRGERTSRELVEQIKNRLHLQQSFQTRLELHKHDGSPFWADMTVLNGCQQGGRCRAIALLRDASLEVARAATEQQRDRLEALGRLAGGLAHEINNLLQPARLYTEMLGDELAPGSMGQEFLRDITTGLEQISSIVKNTLQFSRKNEDQGELTIAPAGALMTSSLSYLSGLLPPSIAIHVDGAECGLPIALKKTELTQVLGNLLINATQAMEGRGQIRLQLYPITLDGVKVANHSLPHGLYIRLTVTDTGCGMDEETASHIFEPFFTTKAPGEGTGLGLSVVYGLVTGWGGDIRVSSQPHKGTCFTILIPVSTFDQGEKNDHKESIAGGRHGGRAALHSTSSASSRA